MPAEPWQLVIQERGAGRYQMLGAAMAVSHIQGRTLEGIGFLEQPCHVRIQERVLEGTIRYQEQPGAKARSGACAG